MTTITQNITSMPTPALSRIGMSDEAFITAADADVVARGVLTTELNAWTGQVNTVAGEVNTNATNAATSETNAAASAAAAAASSGATIWVSGTTYAIGDVRFSPINFISYRRTTTGGGTTDPSLDTTNWASLSATASAGATVITYQLFGGI